MKTYKALLSLFLFFIGGVWLNYAIIEPLAKPTRDISDSRALEVKLHIWVTSKIEEGKLTQSDMDKIFNEHNLQLGGERPNETYKEMIQRIAKPIAPPTWPGYALAILGFVVIFYTPKAMRQK